MELLYGHTLGQVAGLINIPPEIRGNVIRQQLQRHRHHNRAEGLIALGDIDHFPAVSFNILIPFRGHADDQSLAGGDFLDI